MCNKIRTRSWCAEQKIAHIYIYRDKYKMFKGINNKPFINLDEYIDIEILTSLDFEIKNNISLAKTNSIKYYKSNLLYKDNELHPDFYSELHKNIIKNIDDITLFPHNEEITLRKALNYPHKGNEKLCEYTNNAKIFPKTMAFLETLPISRGRIVIFTNNPTFTGILHKDTISESQYHKSMFFWLRTNLEKKFFVLDTDTLEKHYIDSYSAFFNSYDYHGHDDSDELMWSIRIDGIFTDEFKKKIGIDNLKCW